MEDQVRYEKKVSPRIKVEIFVYNKRTRKGAVTSDYRDVCNLLGIDYRTLFNRLQRKVWEDIDWLVVEVVDFKHLTFGDDE